MSGLQHAERLWNNILALGGRRIAALSLIGVVVFLAVGLGAYYLSRPAQETLYTGLSREDVGRIGSVLKDANIPFDVSADGAAVLVSYGNTATARMLLAEKGLPQSAKSGYELFNDLGSLGMTSFMQEVTRVRALEGEIARTIQGMKGVKAARVHIVLPDRGSFRRDQQPPSASVVVRTEPADDVSGAQSIRHLVASAVPGMKPDRVTVIGSGGSLLLSGDDTNAQPTGKMATLEKTIGHEVQDNIRRTLTPYLGVGNFEVSVAARLNTDKTVKNETIFNPDQRVERSTRAVRETENAQNRNAAKTTSAAQNLPDARTRSDGNDSSSNETQKREDLTNYEISSQTIQTVSDGYAIRQISVAVLVNRARLASLAGPDATKAQIDAQVAEIEQLVGSAAGFNKERGDNVKVAAVGFVNDGQPLEAVPPLGIMDVLMRQSATLINAGTILLVAGLLIWFGLRPAMRAILEIPAAQQEEVLALAAATAAANGNAALADGTAPGLALGNSAVGAGDVPSLAAPAGGVAGMIEDLADKLARSPQKRLEQMIETDEAQAAEILKRWLLREAA
ncbi:flagellar M-ring protein FliF [Methylobacterium sp. Leaf469]|jgi:flagellar M-ring protein FliF|uniref:flagellar basal-body MS-ring/collar protein FliF n=1 Tax=unclassified Methylobacterium TaxID=2615210 RepID=UPI0006F8F74A|nr:MULTISPECIES: flagellar basal-body MS-ring/collar protein FliF [unclassified Methylobacterium]USU33505.1 flagellar M-ring protein FliF [Methylobacterium sp. OTU13CASTA1]KQO69560.1 flagellar M-ring protein FliF [Methylobacterium sp. Leaf87]KQP34407.1 flagellar M-ring protein FliF [Methylobacterium sp. Leaf102]KQP36803.1 flagellar M-ring protein FliF [Methylobacterium sp. Leaf100]KQP72236.1 flagellar M-ring protein FliF [Methylobacterium sp. Leaf112]